MRAPFVRPLLCGLVPLLAGVTVWALWRATRSDPLTLVGMAVIGLGAILSIVGVATWIVDAWRLRTEPPMRTAGALVRAALAVVLLVACYPAAAAIIGDVERQLFEYRFEVENDSDSPLTSCRVFGGGVDLELGPVAPGESARATFRIDHEDELRCTLESGGATHDVLVEGYVTNGVGGHAVVSIDESGSPSVRGGGR